MFQKSTVENEVSVVDVLMLCRVGVDSTFYTALTLPNPKLGQRSL